MRRIDRNALKMILVLLMAFAVGTAHAAQKRGEGKGGGGGNARTSAGARATKGAGTAVAPQTGDPNARLEKQIAVIKAAPDGGARAEAAGGLIDAIVGSDIASITPQTISDVTALLSDHENVVRYWAALTLAQIGPRATAATPALNKALKDAEKLAADDGTSPAKAICVSFQRIGVKPEDGRCVNGQYLNAKEKAAYDASEAAKAAKAATQPAKNVTVAPSTAAPAPAPQNPP